MYNKQQVCNTWSSSVRRTSSVASLQHRVPGKHVAPCPSWSIYFRCCRKKVNKSFFSNATKQILTDWLGLQPQVTVTKFTGEIFDCWPQRQSINVSICIIRIAYHHNCTWISRPVAVFKYFNENIAMVRFTGHFAMTNCRNAVNSQGPFTHGKMKHNDAQHRTTSSVIVRHPQLVSWA